jgi:hypothetical protein
MTRQQKGGDMTTFRLAFADPEATADKRFLGVAIFDMDESERERSITEIVKRSHELGVNPGGAVSVQEVPGIPDEHKNKLTTDDALLLTVAESQTIAGVFSRLRNGIASQRAVPIRLVRPPCPPECYADRYREWIVQ